LNLIRKIDSTQISEETISDFIIRSAHQIEDIKQSVINILNEVKLKGDKAIIEFSKEFDQVELKESDIKVSELEIREAYDQVDDKLLEAIKYAKKNLIKFHQAQLREEWNIEIVKGVKAGQIYRPLESVGLYIPGGRAPYPSTVLMAATPAFVSGVKNVILCSPPQKNKKTAPEILVAANEFNISQIFKVGGVQAIAAMVYGTNTIPKVQKIIGPGNKWVNAAKQLVSTEIAIDNPAGPSEVLIIADENADFNLVLLDLISQIEHDPDNIGIIISNSSELLTKCENNLEPLISKSKRKTIISSALQSSLLIQAKDLEDCIRISNLIAPEHLEILIDNPHEILPKIKNAGAIFLGPYSPVPLGDYSAGTNHILPTGGTAKTYSGLNIYDFLRIINVLECNKEGLKNLSQSAATLAEFEGLIAHKNSIIERLKDKYQKS
jgi:histidinol dehydrogenase